MIFFLLSVPLLSSTFFFVLMIRRPPRSTLDRSSAASDVYKRQVQRVAQTYFKPSNRTIGIFIPETNPDRTEIPPVPDAVSYTHLRAHETVLDLVCRLLLEKKKKIKYHPNKNKAKSDAKTGPHTHAQAHEVDVNITTIQTRLLHIH